MSRNAWVRAFCLGNLILAAPTSSPASAPGPVVGLDHIPLVVHDLASASDTFRALGFAIKPGRAHANGLRNAHVKFPDGSGIELITAGEADDDLSARYLKLLEYGEGPAFLALHARETDRLLTALRGGGYAFGRDGGLTTLRAADLDYLFVVRDNRSPTDRPEHFAHRNGATGLQAVWIATGATAELERFLVQLGGAASRRTVYVPDSVTATVVRVDRGEVVILPVTRQVVPGRPIVGASFRVSHMERLRRHLAAQGIAGRIEPGSSSRVLVPPAATHGLWLEFR